MITTPNNLKLNAVNIDKILTVLGSVLVLAALCIIAFTPQASAYESSIYAVYPAYFWLIIIASLSCGIIILIRNVFRTNNRLSGYAPGLVLIIVTNLIIITLPIFRGYFISDVSDEVSHLGLIKDIVLSGHFGVSNTYPISHILASQTNLLTGMDSRLVIKIIPSIFYLVYLAGLLLLTRQTSKNIRAVLLVMAFSAPLLFTYFNYQFYPTHFCLYIVPMFLFLFFRRTSSQSLNDTILFYIFLLVIPFLHPLGSLFIVGIFIFLGLADLTRYLFLKKGGDAQVARLFTWEIVFPPAIILIVLFFSWFFNFNLFKIVLLQAIEGGVSPLDIMVQQGATAGLSLLDFGKLLFNNYGQDLLMLILAFIAVLIVAKKLFSRNNTVKSEEIFFSYLILVFAVFYLATVVGSFMITGRSIRILCWSLAFCVLLNGIVFQGWIAKLRQGTKTWAITGLTLIIIICCAIGIFNVYFSPSIKRVNTQATLANIQGAQWALNSTDSASIIYMNQVISRAPDYLYGIDSPKFTLSRFYSLPDHFGYVENKPIPEYLTGISYFSITQLDLEGKRLFPDVGVYTVDELDQFRYNPGVNRIYFNGDTEIMEVLPTTWIKR